MLSVVIQAGGESRRMGKNKALLSFLGQPLIARVAKRLSRLGAEMFVTANSPEDFAFLGLPLVADLIPGRGALGGLYTALATASSPFVAVVACDMPFANSAIFQRALERIINQNADVVIPEPKVGTLEPLHAIYRRETCLPHIQAAIAADSWKVISWFGAVKVLKLPAAELSSLDPAGLAFWNVNTPEEFARAELLASKEEA